VVPATMSCAGAAHPTSRLRRPSNARSSV
jgi:hypothetical protein